MVISDIQRDIKDTQHDPEVEPETSEEIIEELIKYTAFAVAMTVILKGRTVKGGEQTEKLKIYKDFRALYDSILTCAACYAIWSFLYS